MKEQQNADLPNSDSLGETADNQKGKLSDVMQGFSKTNEINLNKEEQKMTNIKKQEKKSEDSELNLQKLLARNVCKIAENRDVIWNEEIFVRFLEKSGFRKVILTDNYVIYVQIKDGEVKDTNPNRMWSYFLGFLDFEVYDSSTSSFLIQNYSFFPPNVLKALKEELYEDVFSLDDDEIDFNLSDATRLVPPIPPREALKIV